ncbi:MAG TPA: B12-binding domain-containing radical SAM protein [Clostridiales bacterium]|nr:B12-binding domain-containing radical SAM protein [Clostridiales bacterium]
MNVLLIRPKPSNETIGLQHVMICEPLELEYLAGNISHADVNIDIIDMIIEHKPIEYFIKKHQPDIVGMTGYITHVKIIKEFSRQIKSINPGIVVVVGGIHAEVVPEDFVSTDIDFIVEANPIDTFNDIIGYVKGRTGDDIRHQRHVSGTYQIGEISLKRPIFEYAMPDRSKVDRYRSRYYYMFHNPCALMKTSFGCPYNCSFCFCKEITDGKYYERNLDSVIEELKTIEEEEIYIVDDDFLYSRKRLIDFCNRLEEINIQKKYLVYGRADFIANNEDLIERLAKNGLSAVIVGLESYRDKDLDNYNKHISIKENEKAVNVLKKFGIELYATLILPMDFTKNDFINLGLWIKKMGIIFVNLQPLTPLPGTDIFSDYEKDLIIERNDFEKWDLAHLALKPIHLSIRAYYLEIIKLYYRIVMSPTSIRHMIGKYGLKQVLKLSKGSLFVTGQYILKFIKG